MATPDWGAWLAAVWGPPAEGPGFASIIGAASNVVVGSNPPYTIQDFFSLFPKYGGIPLQTTATLVADVTQITVTGAATGIAAGMPIAGNGIPDGTFVQSVSGNTVTLTNSASASASGVTILVWTAPPIPVAALLAYIALASASLVQARWLDSWTFAMALFVAHYASLYAKSDGNPTSNVGQIAAQGIATGIQVSKSAGDVNVSYQAVQGIKDWGAWNLTVYGQQLATMARSIGSGPMFLY